MVANETASPGEERVMAEVRSEKVALLLSTSQNGLVTDDPAKRDCHAAMFI
jgi:hypothetical protein